LEDMKKGICCGGIYGDDPRVIDATWRELFPDNAEGGPAEGWSLPHAMKGEWEPGGVVRMGRERGRGEVI
jgi:hypothetical protein